MKNNLENMPNPAQEPEGLEVEQEDIDALMKSFEDKQRAHAIEESISETTAELSKEQMKRLQLEQTSVVEAEAASAAQDIVDRELEKAAKLLDSDPSVAVMTLLKPVAERLQAKLDPEGGFDRPHGDPRVQAMYDRFAQDLKRDAIGAVAKVLEARWESLPDGDPGKARIGRLIGLVESQAGEKKESAEEIRPLADELEPEPAPPPKKSFWQKLLGKK